MHFKQQHTMLYVPHWSKALAFSYFQKYEGVHFAFILH